MVSLNVLSVNGDTSFADSSYSVNPRKVYLGWEDGTSSSRCYLEHATDEGKMDLLLVSSTVTNLVTALNAGALLKVFLEVTFLERNERAFGKDVAGRTGFINFYNVIVAYDYDSNAWIEYAAEHKQSVEILKIDEQISTIVSAAADISAGAETIPFPLTSKVVDMVLHKTGEQKMRYPRTYLINENFVNKVIEGFRNDVNITALGYAKLKVETIIALNDGGAGYGKGDVLTGSGGTGTEATFTVSKVAPVDAQDETDYDNSAPNGTFAGGTGHAPADVITLDEGTTITVDAVDGGGAVTEFTVDSSASTGNATDHDTLAQSSTTGSGTGFTLTCGDANQRVFELTLTTAGSYSELPDDIADIDLTGGTGTGANIEVDYEVESIVITNSGSGYSSAPAVTISGGGGSGATATSTLSGDRVISTTISAAGNNFTSIPTVAFAAPGSKTAWMVKGPVGGERGYVF